MATSSVNATTTTASIPVKIKFANRNLNTPITQIRRWHEMRFLVKTVACKSWARAHTKRTDSQGDTVLLAPSHQLIHHYDMPTMDKMRDAPCKEKTDSG
jgi:hypothetical protein